MNSWVFTCGQVIYINLLPCKAKETSWKMGQKECKHWRIKKKDLKCWHLNIAAMLRAATHNNWSCLHKICAKWSQVKLPGWMGECHPILYWRSYLQWISTEEGASVSLGHVVTAEFLMTLWMATYPCIYRQHWLDIELLTIA